MWTDELNTNVLGVLIPSCYRLLESRSVVRLDVYSTNKQSVIYHTPCTVYLIRVQNVSRKPHDSSRAFVTTLQHERQRGAKCVILRRHPVLKFNSVIVDERNKLRRAGELVLEHSEKKPCDIITLPTTNPTWTSSESNPFALVKGRLLTV
jgi:hypothetical protein